MKDGSFVVATNAKLSAKAIGRREMENNSDYDLIESKPVGSSCPVIVRRAKSEAGSEA
jgi:hypothetical protein